MNTWLSFRSTRPSDQKGPQFSVGDNTVIAPERFAAAMHLSQQDLAQLARVPRTTVAEAPTNAKLRASMRDTLRVLSAAMAVTGGRDRGDLLVPHTPIPEFRHQTAEHLASTGKADAVVSHLLSIESGSTGWSSYQSGPGRTARVP